MHGFFFQNNTKFQTILLVSIVSKLFRKLTSQVLETQFYCSNSSITESISMKIYVKIESVRLEFHKNTKTKKQQTREIKTRWRRRRLKSSSQSLWVGFFVLLVDFLSGSWSITKVLHLSFPKFWFLLWNFSS